MDLTRFRRLPLLGILRGIRLENVVPLVEATAGAGLEAIEITMNTAGAPALIGRMVAEAAGRLMIGAGTVLGTDDLDRALDAGASFAVMPVLIPQVVERCAARGIPAFPGALTPQEIFAAWRAGAAMVKVFPASCFGPGYMKEIKGPFGDLELLACGGVNAENLASYLAAGASAAAFGGSIFRPEWLAQGDYSHIGAAVRTMVEAHRQWLGSTGAQ